MINVQFFPSRRIAIYMARTFIVRSLAVLAGLLAVLATLDVLGESGRIFAYHGNGDAELWRYVSLRIPQMIQQFLPFALLLGALITFAGMNQHSEIISMKAAGISAHQIVAPLILTCLAIAAVNFAFNERVVTRATATLNAWVAVHYGRVPPTNAIRSNVWVRAGTDLVLARQVTDSGPETGLYGVTVWDRAGGTLQHIVSADSGRWTSRGWELTNASVFDVGTATMARQPIYTFGADIDPIQFRLAKVVPEEQDFFTLSHSIDELDAAGRPVTALRAALWHKIARPLSSILMPLLAAIAAFGLARSGQLFVRAVIGMALGFCYFVADNFALAMGNFGAYPPPIAAWGPFILFLLIGETVLIRTEE
ncbi:MAG: LPS export ABC transporter permease LptG [Acetobacteraceae bacterium]|nr:LPS export ABC transporter permease LptG [Acetobacteraceae bacterium]